MNIAAAEIAKMSQADLDDLYEKSPMGEIPDGNSRGTAMILPGSLLSRILIPIIRLLFWQGKVFHRDQSYLLNKVLLIRLRLVKAEIYRGESWLTQGESIILDYSKTSFVAQKIRDEIREVAPGIYLGQAYWGKMRILNFMLEF